MEQERVIFIVVISTFVVLLFSIAIIVLFCILYKMKSKLLENNKILETIIKTKLAALLDKQ